MNKKHFILALLTAFPFLCWAHPNHLGYHGYFAGFLHPLTGLDHTLAMIAVGVIASQKGRYWVWLLPAIFITFMIIGGIFGYSELYFPWYELGISISVFTLGLCISFPSLLPSFILLAMCMAFAFCHGFAHGAEIPNNIQPMHYVFGFIAATALLHFTGLMIGKILIPKQRTILQLSGIAMALSTFII